jgi:hypothetical protein
MKITRAIQNLEDRRHHVKMLIEKEKIKQPELDYRKGELAALEIAIRCVKMAVLYGVVALTNEGEPLFLGQCPKHNGAIKDD